MIETYEGISADTGEVVLPYTPITEPVHRVDELAAPERLEGPAPDDPVRQYLERIGRVALLNAEQEIELAKTIEAGLFAEQKLLAGQHGDATAEELEELMDAGQRAKLHLQEANLRLVVSIARKYPRKGMELLDVVQEGNIGLGRAVEKFDYRRGFKFSTYATWWIRQAIGKGVADNSRLVRLPMNIVEQVAKMSRIERQLQQVTGILPSDEALADEMGLEPENIGDLRRWSADPLSLDARVADDTEVTYGERFEDTLELSPAEIVEGRMVATAIRQALDELGAPGRARDADVVRLRSGLVDGVVYSLKEIGEHYGLSASRISQIDIKMKARLKRAHPELAGFL